MYRVLKSLILIFGMSTAMSGQIYMDMAMDTSMSFDDIVEEGEAFFDLHGKGQHTGYKSFKRWEYWMKRCLDKSGHMMSNESVKKAFALWQKESNNNKRQIDIPDWEEIGPLQAGNTNGWSSHIGRLSAVAVDDNNLNHIIVGSPSGGVWKSLDAGNTWTPIYDNEIVLDVYSLAISPHDSNIYYVGTWGGGMIKSIDAGKTWYETNGIHRGSRIIDIAISPTNPNVCLVVNEGGNIFHSFNAGETWAISLLHNATLYNVMFRPGDGDVVYAAGKGSVFKSTDEGWTFTELQGPWQNSIFDLNPIMLAVTEDDPDYLYVLEADNGGFGALYRSTNAGQTFGTMSHNFNQDNNLMGYVKNRRGGQAPRDMAIAVNPLDKNEVHIGGIMTHRSLDGGINWEQTSHWLRDDPLPFIHADVDQIVYKRGRAFFATDGGLFTSDDSGVSFEDKSTGLGIRQFYRIAVSKDGTLVVGGSQDNGTGLYRDTDGWWDFVGADGMEPAIGLEDPDIIYASIQYGNIYKTSNGGNRLDGGLMQTPGFGDWVTPLQHDPLEPKTVYQGKNQLYKSTDGILSWTVISDFKNTDPQDSSMQEIAISPVDNNFIIAAFEKQVYKTEDGGANWEDITPPFAFSNVNFISLHPHDMNWLAMTLSGTDNRVVQTTDGGKTWNSLMQGLPNVAAESILYEGGPKNGLYVSMDPGVYYRSQDYPEWISLVKNLPTVLVAEIEQSQCDIYAATYGRGLWRNEIMDDSQMYADLDGDGYGDESNAVRYCSAPAGYTFIGGDCDDTNPDVHPGAEESCNGYDDNCDGLVDSEDPNLEESLLWYQDADGDGYGNDNLTEEACEQPDGYVNVAGDCDDSDSAVNPQSEEICNGYDDNCDGLTDGEDSSVPGFVVWYKDADGDGYGNDNLTEEACEQPDGYVNVAGDCDDADSAINPQAQEICNGYDDNCDGLTDGEDSSVSGFIVWYKDADGDGYGNDNLTEEACEQPDGHVNVAGDCDDADSAINPEAQELCNGYDDNCDGLTDGEDSSVSGPTVWYQDADGDGYGNADVAEEACTRPDGYVDVSGDCLDADSGVYPSAGEICDGIDNNCNGEIDENCLPSDDCDANFLFIHTTVKDDYHAGTTLYSDAKLSGNNTHTFAAGTSIELIPGFEVDSGVQFEAIIKPCFNGVSPANQNVVKELTIIDTDINKRLRVGELVHVRIYDVVNNRNRSVIYSKSYVNLENAVSKLPQGEYVVYVESNSLSWNKAIIISSRE